MGAYEPRPEDRFAYGVSLEDNDLILRGVGGERDREARLTVVTVRRGSIVGIDAAAVRAPRLAVPVQTFEELVEVPVVAEGLLRGSLPVIAIRPSRGPVG